MQVKISKGIKLPNRISYILHIGKNKPSFYFILFFCLCEIAWVIFKRHFAERTDKATYIIFYIAMKDISTNVFFDKFEKISTVLSHSICLFTVTLPYQFSFPFSFSLLRQKDKKVIKLNFHWIYSSAPHFFSIFRKKCICERQNYRKENWRSKFNNCTEQS